MGRDDQNKWPWFLLSLIVLVGILTVALKLRMAYLPWSFVGADSIGPFWRTWRILNSGEFFPTLHVPESGYALYYGLLPTFIGADSLQELLQNSAKLGAFVCLPIFVGARLYIRGGTAKGNTLVSMTTATLAGLLLALSPELVDTLLAGARTYQAPLWLAVLTGGVLGVLAGRPLAIWWVLLPLPIAMMCHPFSGAFIPGILLIVLPKAFRLSRRHLAGALFLIALIAFPRASQLLAGFLDVGLRHSEDLAHVAFSNSVESGLMKQMQDSFRNAYLTVGAPFSYINVGLFFSPLLLLGIGLFSRKSEKGANAVQFAYFCLLTMASVVGLAVGIRYLQHYHLRVFLPLLSVSFAWSFALLLERPLMALAGLFPKFHSVVTLLGLGGAIGVGFVYQHPAEALVRGEPTFDNLQAIEPLSLRILNHAGPDPRVIDALHIGIEPQIYPAAMVLDQILRGVSRETFPTQPEGLEAAGQYLLLVGEFDALTQLEEGVLSWKKEAGINENAVQFLGAALSVKGPGNSPLGVHILYADNAETMRDLGGPLCGELPKEGVLRFGSPYDYLAQLDRDFGAGWVGLWRGDCLKGH